MSDTNASSNSAAKPRSSGGRWLRRILITLGVVVVVLVLIVALLPTLLSTGPGRRFVVGKVNAAIPGRVDINSISLAWFDGQRAEGVTLYDPEGNAVLTNANADLPDASLWALLRGSHDLGKVTLTVDEVVYEQHADGSNNFTQSLVAEPSEPSDEPGATDWRADATLKAKHITLRAPDMEPVEFDSLDAGATVADMRNIKLTLKSGIAQGGERGSIALDAAVSKPNADAPWSISATADLVAIPVVAIDRLLKADDQLAIALGKSLSGTVAITGDAGNVQADISARTEQASVETHLATVDDGLGMTEKPTRIHLVVTPAIYEKLMAKRGRAVTATLVNPVEISITLDKLTVPLVDGRFALQDLAASGGVTISDVDVSSAKLGRIAVRDLSLSLNTNRLGDELLADLSLAAERDGRQGSLTTNANVKHLIDAQGAVSASTVAAAFDGNLTTLPVAAIDEILQLDNLLTDIAGTEITGNYTATVAPDAAGKLAGAMTINATSDRLAVNLAGNIADDTFTAKPGSTVTLTAAPSLITRLAPTSPVQLADAAKLSIDVSSMTVPLRAFSSDKVRGAVKLRSPRVALAGDEKYAGLVLHDLVIDLPDSSLAKIAGLTIDFALHEGESLAGKVNIAADIAGLTESAAGNITATFPATPGILRRFAPTSPVQLADTANMRIEVRSLSMPLRDFALGKVRGAANVRSPRIALAGDGKYAGLVLRDIVIDMPAASLAETVSLTTTASLFDGETPAGKTTITAKLTGLADSALAGTVTATLTELATTTVDRIAGANGELLALAGERIDRVEASATLGADSTKFGATITDAQLAGKVSGTRAADGAITVDPDSTITATVQPADFARWQARFAANKAETPGTTAKPATATLRLLQPATLRLTFAEARYARAQADGAMIDPARTALLADAAADSIVIQRGEGEQAQRLMFRDVNLRVDARKPTGTIIAKLTSGELATADAKTGEWQPRKLAADTQITGLFDQQGTMKPLGEAQMVSNLAVEALPLDFVEQLLGVDGKLSGILGLLADVSAGGAYPGDVNLSLHSNMADFDVKGVIDSAGMLRLREDVHATIAGSEELSETLLKWGSPVLVDLSESEKALRIHIPAKDFAFPLQGYDAKKIVISNARIEIGTVLLEDSWLLKAISPQLAKLGAALGKSGGGEKVRTTFTPMTVNVRDGIATSGDLWMMTDNMLIGVKGPVDLVNKTANLTIGIAGQTLTHNLSFMRNVVQPKAVYEVSVAGPINALRPDMNAFFGQIAAMKGKAELQGAGGDWGVLGGAVLDTLMKDSKLSPAKGGWPNQPTVVLGAKPPVTDEAGNVVEPGQSTDASPPVTTPPAPDADKPAAADDTKSADPKPQQSADPIGDLFGDFLRQQLGDDDDDAAADAENTKKRKKKEKD